MCLSLPTLAMGCAGKESSSPWHGLSEPPTHTGLAGAAADPLVQLETKSGSAQGNESRELGLLRSAWRECCPKSCQAGLWANGFVKWGFAKLGLHKTLWP